MVVTLGNIALHLALLVAGATAVAGLIGGRTGSRAYTSAATNGVYLVAGLMAVVAGAFLHSFVTHNFELASVAHYSDTRMPFIYVISAFWGGQAGSLTFWTTKLALFSALAVWVQRRKQPLLIPYFATVVMLLSVWLISILLFASSPFETFQVMDAPQEGSGLNPLLQTPLMVIHPPSLLTGYVVMAIPFGFAMAALFSKRLDNEWLAPARRWALVSWLFLSIGNMLGGMWAYEELGWGGYWACPGIGYGVVWCCGGCGCP